MRVSSEVSSRHYCCSLLMCRHACVNSASWWTMWHCKAFVALWRAFGQILAFAGKERERDLLDFCSSKPAVRVKIGIPLPTRFPFFLILSKRTASLTARNDAHILMPAAVSITPLVKSVACSFYFDTKSCTTFSEATLNSRISTMLYGNQQWLKLFLIFSSNKHSNVKTRRAIPLWFAFWNI